MKILIVGAGLGGLTLASFLEETGIEYEIVERSKDWVIKGYSIGFWNNGRNILKKLGLAENFDLKSFGVKNYKICNGRGDLLRNYNLSEFYSSYGMALALIDRKLLHEWLLGKISKGKVKMNMAVAKISQDTEGVTVGFADGSVAKYDLVVGADGLHSTVRGLLFSDVVEEKDDWRLWYAWVDNKFKTERSVVEYIEAGQFISIFEAGDKTLTVMAAPASHDTRDEAVGRIERLKKMFKNETKIVPEIFENLKDEDFSPFDLSHIVLKNWFKDRVVLLGDAAHGFEPYGGIGGSMALEDAYILAGEIIKAHNDKSINDALASYQKQRKPRVVRAYSLSHKMRGWALIRSKILRKIVDFGIPFLPDSFIISEYQKILNEEI